MAKFSRCRTDVATKQEHEKGERRLINHPINLENIVSIQRSENSEYQCQGITLDVPAIVFVSLMEKPYFWVYDTKEEREEDYLALTISTGRG